MPPDALDIGFAEVRFHEVARPDGGVPVIAQLLVGEIDNIRHPRHLRRAVPAEPATEQALNRPLVRMELDEVEPAAQGQVDECDRPVGGVHRSDDVQIVR